MKWEDYNRMNNRQKEEYNYRFKNHTIQISTQGILSTVIIIYLLISIMLFISYLAITDEKFAVYKDSVYNILKSSSQLVMFGVLVILLIVVINVANIIIWEVKEHIWIKRNNIRITSNILIRMLNGKR